jgi:hypothetical protein
LARGKAPTLVVYININYYKSESSEKLKNGKNSREDVSAYWQGKPLTRLDNSGETG